MKSRVTLLTIGLVLSFLPGCTFGPEYQRQELGLNPQYRENIAVGTDSGATLEWWNQFTDPQLQQLLRLALEQNKDLKQAVARVQEARALLGFTKADQFPRLDGKGNVSRGSSSEEILPYVSRVSSDYGLFGQLSFEADLWGKLRRATEAQEADLLSSEYSQRVVVVSLISQVATGYFTLLGFDQRLDMAKKTLESRKGSTNLIRIRFEKGMVPELDVNQAEIEEATAVAAVAALERAQRVSENSLSVLIGGMPRAIERGVQLEHQSLRRGVPVTVPASLLERRPDIRAAEEQVKAEMARVGVAIAQRLPSFSLLGVVGLRSDSAGDLLSRGASTWSIGGDLLGPIVDFGKSRARVEVAEARVQQALANYEKSVIQAVQEVEDALTGIRTYDAEVRAREMQVKAAENAARLSRRRYDDGVSPYLEVLDIERSLFQAQLDLALVRQRYLEALVQLYKALGGGWEGGAAPQGTQP